MCKIREMKSFIGNPFDTEFVDEDDIDTDLDVTTIWNTVDNMIDQNITSDDDQEDELVTNIVFFNEFDEIESDDPNDPDFQLDEEDNYSDMEDLGLDSGHARVEQYVVNFSSDEEDDMDYVTFPLKDEISDTTSQPNEATVNSERSTETNVAISTVHVDEPPVILDDHHD